MRWPARSLPLLLLLLPLATCSLGEAGDEGNGGDECELGTLPFRDVLAQRGDTRHVHDPAVARHDDQYVLFSTGRGIPIRRSEDLVRWTFTGETVFDGDVPSWAASEVPGVEFPWAPDISFFNDRYRLYYSLSTFGSQQSVIGLATTPTLDPTHPDYAWTDHGKVVESHQGDDYNAIDPNVAFDGDDRPCPDCRSACSCGGRRAGPSPAHPTTAPLRPLPRAMRRTWRGDGAIPSILPRPRKSDLLTTVGSSGATAREHGHSTKHHSCSTGRRRTDRTGSAGAGWLQTARGTSAEIRTDASCAGGTSTMSEYVAAAFPRRIARTNKPKLPDRQIKNYGIVIFAPVIHSTCAVVFYMVSCPGRVYRFRSTGSAGRRSLFRYHA